MYQPTYSVARAVAGRVLEHFAGHLEVARASGRTNLAPAPDTDAVENMIDVAFWASLRREEGHSPRISLAYVSPDQVGLPLRFRDPFGLHPVPLAKLAPAVERASIHLGVWRDGEPLRVWGTARHLPAYCFVIEVAASGLLVIKQQAGGKFINVAVLEGDQIKIVNEHEAAHPDCPPVLQSLLGFDASGPPGRPASVMVQLAASMRSHGHGGTLLRVPADSSTWQESIVSPLLYTVDPPYPELANLIRKPDDSDEDGLEWQDELRYAVDAVAGLTAVDGATVLNDRYQVLAFGVKIRPRASSVPIERVVITEPIEGSAVWREAPARLGGTRHLSAAQFVFDQRRAVALVASQDGNFTIFRWSEAEQMVHAHRVEALLL